MATTSFLLFSTFIHIIVTCTPNTIKCIEVTNYMSIFYLKENNCFEKVAFIVKGEK